jgi:hypothetical protein
MTPESKPLDRYHWERDRDGSRYTINIYDRKIGHTRPIAIAIDTDTADDIVKALNDYSVTVHELVFGVSK